MPVADEPEPATTSDLSSAAQSSLQRLNRRHSLPASTALSSFLAYWTQDDATNSRPSTNNHGAESQVQAQMRNFSLATNSARHGHMHGHRRARSEMPMLNQPVIVNTYKPSPPPPPPRSPTLREDDEEFVPLPSISEVSWKGVLKAVQPQVNSLLDSVTGLCNSYQDSVGIEVRNLTTRQGELETQIKGAERLAVSVLKTTRTRTDRLEAESAGLKRGAAVDALAEATELTHTTLTTILSTLLAIDDMLPPQDRLSPETSAHRKHYPKLHALLAGKAAEVNSIFGYGRANRRRSSAMSGVAENHDDEDDFVEDSEAPRTQQRRLSSSSQHLLGPGGLKRASTFSESRIGVATPPQLQLKTVLPSGALESAKVVESSKGSYFPLAPEAPASVSLATPYGSLQSPPPPLESPSFRPLTPSHASHRNSGFWGRRPSTSAMAFRPINENEGLEDPGARPPPTPSRTLSWRGSGSWSGIGGLWSGRSTWGSKEQAIPESAEERLRRVLEVGVGKGKDVVR